MLRCNSNHMRSVRLYFVKFDFSQTNFWNGAIESSYTQLFVTASHQNPAMDQSTFFVQNIGLSIKELY